MDGKGVDVKTLVDRFCGLEWSQPEHEDAEKAIEGGIVEGRFSIADVVTALGSHLTSTSEPLRARGTLLLAVMLEKLPPSAGYVDAQQQKFLLAL